MCPVDNPQYKILVDQKLFVAHEMRVPPTKTAEIALSDDE
jgi:hypothetical protein